MHLSPEPGVWLAAILTLAGFSFLWKDNPMFKVMEHMLVGVSAGYYLVQYAYSAIFKKLYVPLVKQGNLLFAGCAVLGLMAFARLFPKRSWLSRYPVAFYVAAGAGYSVPSTIQARVIKQMQVTMINVFDQGSLGAGVSSFLLFVGVITVLLYFFFSAEHRGPLGAASKIGIVTLMIGFGASFGYTVMSRITLLIGRFQFLLGDWLGFL
ncbi:MAG: hypothetical protein MUE60_01760 [Candidatus Eisenbacteria bacterium]|jgi:hypothetical protein|nr:hypothetical protein [Candidatus Eisenbacteria bacterium]